MGQGGPSSRGLGIPESVCSLQVLMELLFCESLKLVLLPLEVLEGSSRAGHCPEGLIRRAGVSGELGKEPQALRELGGCRGGSFPKA